MQLKAAKKNTANRDEWTVRTITDVVTTMHHINAWLMAKTVTSVVEKNNFARFCLTKKKV